MKKGDKDNSDLYGSFIDPFDKTIDPFEHVSDEELSYIKETQSSIIASRKWYSWHKDIGEYSPEHTAPLKKTFADNNKNSSSQPAGIGRKKIYNKHILSSLILAQSQPSLPSTAYTPEKELTKVRGNAIGHDSLSDLVMGTLSHSSPLKNTSPVESKAVAAEDYKECENSLNPEFSDGEGDFTENVDEYYFDESEDDEQDISLLSSNGADSTDPELLHLSTVDDDYVDDDYAELAETEQDYQPESENSFLGDIASRSDIDWLDVDTNEFEDELSQYRDIEVTTSGKISRHDRAFQIALGIGEEFDLERDEIDFLADLFHDSGWSATKTSIIQALKNHSTIEELRLAYAVKLFWREHSEFTSSYSNQYNVLSWPTAIAIIRSFGSYPDIVEVESILFYIFECWEADLMLQRTFKEFGYYLYYRFGCIDRTLDIMPEWTFETDPLVSHDWLMPPSTLDIPNLTEFKSERQLCKIRLRYAES